MKTQLTTALTLAAFSLATQSAYAERFAIGLGLNQASVSVEDPKGDTDKDTPGYISLIGTYNIDEKWRIWSEISKYDFDLEYSPTYIGQHVDTLQFDVIAQYAKPFGTFTYGWVGAGLGMSFTEYSERAKTLESGHLNPFESYEDRDETNYHLILNIGILRGITSDITIGGNVKHSVTMNDGYGGTTITGYISYQL